MRVIADDTPKESFPLTWPERWPRTPGYRIWASKFGKQGKTLTLGRACETLAEELRRLGASAVIISSNLRVRMDGVPYSDQGQPKDKGIAVYFTLKKSAIVLACDRWDKIEHNVYAIAKHIEALRGQDRWGVGSIEQAFAGYTAIPEKTGGLSWWEVLGIQINAGEEQVRDAYHKLARIYHPDSGSKPDHERMVQLNEAYRMATSQKLLT